MLPEHILKQLRRLQYITTKNVDSTFGGDYKSAFRGQGMEFVEVRPYQQGDDVRNIDWNVTARSHEPYVKVFKEERELAVGLLVDVSGSTHFGSSQSTKSTRILELMALIGYTAAMNQDLLSSMFFSDQVEAFSPSKKGLSHVHSILETFLSHRAKSKGTDLTAALTEWNRRHRKPNLTFLMTDATEVPDLHRLKLTCFQHDLIVLHVLDDLDMALPQNLASVMFEDAETGEFYELAPYDSSFKKNFQDRARQSTENFRKAIVGCGGSYLRIMPNQDSALELRKLFAQRFAGLR